MLALPINFAYFTIIPVALQLLLLLQETDLVLFAVQAPAMVTASCPLQVSIKITADYL